MLSSSPPLNAPPAAAAAAAAGLDSLAALKIAETLHDFCTTGMIVLCTMYVACLPTHPHLIDIPTTPPPKKKRKPTHSHSPTHSHQPRHSIWRLFTKVLILGKGHQLFYGTPDAAEDWFTAGLGLTLPPKTSPSDFIM